MEFDGTVYLEQRNGVLDLPDFNAMKERFNLSVRARASIDGTEVAFCYPEMDTPPEWPLKDEALLKPGVSEIAKRAIILSYPRVVVGGICTRIIGGEERILLVKPRRGLYTDWMLPGGFIEYWEGAMECLEREMKEELGISIKNLRLIGVTSHNLPSHYTLIIILIAFDFDGEIDAVRDEEISEVGWFRTDPQTLEQTGVSGILRGIRWRRVDAMVDH